MKPANEYTCIYTVCIGFFVPVSRQAVP
jgi:hypothetical protein